MAGEMREVDAVIKRRLASNVALVNQIADYIISAGGKRMRPMLVLLFSRALGFEGPERFELAATVEFIHTATLVHDDIIDDADVRRGRKSAHAQWGNDVTVLAGDFLYIPADLPHKPINLSDTETAEAIVARTDPDEQESVEHVAEPEGEPE